MLPDDARETVSVRPRNDMPVWLANHTEDGLLALYMFSAPTV